VAKDRSGYTPTKDNNKIETGKLKNLSKSGKINTHDTLSE